MKILEITFENINNLKGKNVISFTDLPLSAAGIFAITGPTGSGKSTILDVITLALFNRIPRFKKAISKSAIEGLGSVITHHTESAEATVLFEIRGQRYRSAWSVSKTKAGNLKDYEMYVFDGAGTPLDLKKSEVPAHNEAIIGLKYDQFIKSIILSQGQFSRFLKADKNERGQLLENLTGSHIYRKLGAAAYERHKSVKSEVTLELELIKNIHSLSDEERTELVRDTEILTKKKSEVDTQLRAMMDARNAKAEAKSQRAVLAEKIHLQDKLQVEIDQFATRMAILDQYENLRPLRTDLLKYQMTTQSTKELQRTIAAHRQSVTQARELHRQAIMDMARLAGQDVTAENFMEVMSAFEKEVNALDQKLQYTRERGSEIRQKINQKVSKAKLQIDPKSKPIEALQLLRTAADTARLNLRTAEISPDSDSAEVRTMLMKLTEDIQALTQLQHQYAHIRETVSQVKVLAQQKAAATAEIEKYEPLQTTVRELLITLEDHVTVLRQREEDAKLIASLSEHRASLVEGEPCPLCGALDHPYAEHLPRVESDLQEDIKATIAKMEQHREEQLSYSKKVTSAKTSMDMITKRSEALVAEMTKLEREVAQHQDTLHHFGDISESTIVTIMADQQERKERLSKGISSLEQYRLLVELIDDFTSIQHILQDHTTLAQKRKGLYTGDNVSHECNKIQNTFSKAETVLSTKTALLDKDEEAMQRTLTQIDDLSGALLPRLRDLGYDSIEAAVAHLIDETEVTQIKAQKDAIAQRSAALSAEINAIKAKIEEYHKTDTIPDVELEALMSQISVAEGLRDQYTSVMGQKAAIIARDDQERARIADKQKRIDELNTQLHKWDLLNRIIGNADGSKFANFAQGLTLQNLLSYANRRLKNLSDRYLIDKPQKDGALTVIDQYQGNIQRSVTTLSGGESFLISLALALSLSDMASKNVRLESLFIDEGFGTLDQETLDVAMNTLERLQTESQKTVGVISHVEALKERIQVQIRLEKDAMGYSKVEVVG